MEKVIEKEMIGFFEISNNMPKANEPLACSRCRAVSEYPSFVRDPPPNAPYQALCLECMKQWRKEQGWPETKSEG